MDENSNVNMIPFSYVLQSSTITANGTGVGNLQFDSDSSFELFAIVATSTADVNSDFSSNNFSVLLRDGTTGRAFANQQIPQRVFAGNAFNGILERRPVVFVPNSKLSADFTNLTGNANFIVTITLHGYKRFTSQV